LLAESVLNDGKKLAPAIEALPARTRRLRRERRLSLADVAELVGIGISDLSRFETGRTGPRGFSQDRLLRIARWADETEEGS